MENFIFFALLLHIHLAVAVYGHNKHLFYIFTAVLFFFFTGASLAAGLVPWAAGFLVAIRIYPRLSQKLPGMLQGKRATLALLMRLP